MKIKYYLPTILTGLILTSGCAPMTSDNGPTLEERIAMQDRQLRQIQPQQADTWNEVQAMRQEINDLKGQLDDLKNVGGARALVSKVQQHDTALRQMDDNMGLNLNIGEPLPPKGIQVSQAQPGMPIGQNPQETGIVPHTPDSSAYGTQMTTQSPAIPAAIPGTTNPAVAPAQRAPVMAQSPQTGSYGLPPDNPPVVNNPQVATAPTQVVAPSESTWGKADPTPQTEAPVAKKDISLALFDAGVNAYNARNYNEAAKSFTDFVKNYKNHTQSAEAQYYLADCDFQRNKFNNAIVGYQTVIEKYPKSGSAPKAYLKQAICFGKIGNRDAARLRMQELIKKYPKSPEVARARNYLKTNK